MTLVGRVALSCILPLTDATESRYGEIARKMLETGDWITLKFDYGVPFWGKPPLSSWMSAGSMWLFGINEFAARLPSLLMLAGSLWFVSITGRSRCSDGLTGLLAVTIVATFPLTFVVAGAVMTDAALAFSTTLSFLAFWKAVTEQSPSPQKIWGYLFFIAQGVGLLSKGPICLVLTFGPLILWGLTGRSGVNMSSIRRLPWISGGLLMLAIAAPWYVMAEMRTPGFLDYFIVGEHFKRFMVSGWDNDKYGRPNKVPFGMIWLYWGAAVFPWSLVLGGWLLCRYSRLKAVLHDQDGWMRYLVCWAVFPMLFFMLARNVLWTYVLTGLPAFGLFATELWQRSRQAENAEEIAYTPLYRLMLLPAVLALSASLILLARPDLLEHRTQKYLVERYLTNHGASDSRLVYLFTKRYSAEFYTRGKVISIDKTEDLRLLLNSTTGNYFAMKKADLFKIPADIQNRLSQVSEHGKFILFKQLATDQVRPISGVER